MESRPMTDAACVGAAPARPTTATALKANIEVLQAEIANLEALMAAHQAEFRTSDVERDRAEQLLADLLRMTADLMSAREVAVDAGFAAMVVAHAGVANACRLTAAKPCRFVGSAATRPRPSACSGKLIALTRDRRMTTAE
jgi:hypothetical protein